MSRLLLTGRQVDTGEVLGILGEAVGVNRCYLFRFRDGGGRMDNTHEWCSPGTEPQIQKLQDLETRPPKWTLRRLRQNCEITVHDVARMPTAAAFERQFVTAQGVRAYLLVPFILPDSSRVSSASTIPSGRGAGEPKRCCCCERRPI